MGAKSVIGGNAGVEVATIELDVKKAHEMNTEFWDTVGSEYLGVTALPKYGAFVSEEKLHLLGDLQNKKLLEIGCGNGHSIEYVAGLGASELWGLDISTEQIGRTKNYLSSLGIKANLICSSMERECGLPKEYFDVIYSVYAIGWTTNLDKTFQLINSYLKKNGVFIFSWSHPIHKCVSKENEKLVFANSYFDESWYKVTLHEKELMLSNRKLSTYINALAASGFAIEQVIEESDEEMFTNENENDFERKAKMLPVTFVIKARKL